MGARTLGGASGSALETIILASSVLYELIGPGCAKLSLYLSKSYSNKLEDIVEIAEDGHQKSKVELLIERIQAIQNDLPKHENPYYEDEQAFSEAADEQYLLAGHEHGQKQKEQEEKKMNGITAFALSDPIARLLGEWSMGLNTYSIILRIAVAVIFASVIGCERSSKRHSAGLRTFVLISFASTVSMILDIYLMMSYSFSVPVLSAATIIGTAMVSGNSILFSSRNQIKGLTTSAGLWACGILGFTIGAGLYTVTVIVYVFLLCILACFPSLEIYLKNRSNHFEIHLELKSSEYLQDFVAVIRRLGLRIDDIESNLAYVGSGLSVYTITITINSAELKKYKTHKEIIEALSSLEYIYHIEEMR